MILLRASWSERLEAAQLSSSWQGRIEARVLCFLLSRYGDAKEEVPLPDCPIFEGEAPRGRAKLPLSTGQQRARLGHIAAVSKEARLRPLSLLERADRAHDFLVEERSRSPLIDAIKTFVAPHPVLLARLDARFWFSLLRNRRFPE